MAGVVFHGSGSVWMPDKKKFIRFIDGEYTTDDSDEIALLSLKYSHDTKCIQSEESADVSDDKPKRGRRPKNE